MWPVNQAFYPKFTRRTHYTPDDATRFWTPLTAAVTLMTFRLVLPHHLDNAFDLVNLTSALVGIGAAGCWRPDRGSGGLHGPPSSLLRHLARAGLNPLYASAYPFAGNCECLAAGVEEI
jgi:hypothetical protein